MSKKMVVILAVVILLVGAGAAAWAIYNQGSGDYVAKVAGEEVSKSEFNFFLASVAGEMEQNAGIQQQDQKAKESFWSSKPSNDKTANEEAKDKALDRIKEFKIQLIKAKEKNIKLEKSDLDKITENVNSMIKQAGGKDKAESKFKEVYRVSSKEYTEIMKQLMIAYKYMESEETSITASDDEMSKFYKEYIENDSKTTVRHILLLTIDQNTQQPVAEDKKKELKQKAEDLFAKVKGGEDIKKLVTEYSQDPNIANNEGQITIGKGQTDKAFEDWAFKAKPGDVGLVESSFGYHVVKKHLYDEMKDNIKNAVKQDKYLKMMEKWKGEAKYNLNKNDKVLKTINVI